MKSEIEIIEEMQAVVEQMRLDDIEENPDIENDFFECPCCGKSKCLAGSIPYGDFRLCNDCVLFAEVGFETKRFTSVDDLMLAMEDKRLEEICEFIKQNAQQMNN